MQIVYRMNNMLKIPVRIFFQQQVFALKTYENVAGGNRLILKSI